jgi:hypothetical protein
LSDNNKQGKKAKIAIRQKVLDEIGSVNTRVLDFFCGVDGKMYNAVWEQARYYAGIDMRWDFRHDERMRYVGDNKIFARHLELEKYNVFDVDAYGNPWEILEIISKRRKWELGERGALTFTDCDIRPSGEHRVMGLRHHHGPGKWAFDLHEKALTAWLRISRVKQLKRYQVKMRDSGGRWYCGVVFEGLGAGQHLALNDVPLNESDQTRGYSLAERHPIDRF